MNDPSDMAEKDIEQFNRWHDEHSLLVPVNESCRVAVGFTVWDRIEGDGRFRVDINHVDTATGIWRQNSVAYLTPAEAKRLSDLLLAVSAEAAPK